MKALILAGGLGTRLGEITESIPKPMVRLDSQPILWHLMKILDSQGIDEIDLLLGYKGEVIREYILKLPKIDLDFEIVLDGSNPQYLTNLDPIRLSSKLKIGTIDTGLESFTARRIKIGIEKSSNSEFLVTYGDGLADIDISALYEFHLSHGRLATVTAVHPLARFGHLEIDTDRVVSFEEKNQVNEGWINGGFMILNRGVIDYLGDDEPFEGNPMKKLAEDQELMAYRHDGFWHPMDTPSDVSILKKLSKLNVPPWLT